MHLQDAIAVTILPGVARVRAAAALKHLRGDLFAAGLNDVSLEHVIVFCGRADGDVDRVARAAREDAARLLDAASRAGIRAIAWEDERYPPLLRTIPDPPPVLWVQGQDAPLLRPAVALVGSRAASSYAVEVACRLGGELAERGMVVVSGLARGVDGSAHRGAIARGGGTVAVLGSGPDVVYPPEHAELAASVRADGTLVSELGPGAPPLPDHFPKRNRLISGISLAVVVVEASEKSGSLITARYALEHGRDVMAVPGSVLGGRNRGSHALLKDGAKVVETADDILEDLGWPARGHRQISCNLLKTDPLLARLTPGEAYALDELSATVGLEGARLLPRLTEWEMSGALTRLPGGQYVRHGTDR